MNEQSIKDAITTGSRFNTYQTESQIEQVIRWKITDASKLRGQQFDESTIQTICRKIGEVVLRDYPTLTDKEFELMLEAGVSGEFGRETWLSGAAVLQWLRQYSRHASRIAIIDEQDSANKQTKHRKTKEETMLMNDNACREKARSAFEYYKQHGTIFGRQKMPKDLTAAEREAYNADEQRAFHLPQYAAIVWEWINTHSEVRKPGTARLNAAEAYADEQIAKSRTRREYIPAAHDDWRDAYLLEQYYNDIINS